jgi:hypothetical protein
LLQRYQDTVIASFAGHTHADDFRVIGAADGNRLFVLIDPAVSPVYNQNPAFRVVTFDPDGTLADQSTYYLTNLDKATSTVAGVWAKEYTFTEQWKARRLDAASLATLYNQIKNDAQVRDQWFKFYNVSSPKLTVPDEMTRGLYCAAEGLDPASYKTCYCPAAKVKPTVPAASPVKR